MGSNARLPEWAKDANIYEVNIRQYTPEGTLNAFKEHLPRLAEMNVDILWFMPVQPIGATKQQRRAGQLLFHPRLHRGQPGLWNRRGFQSHCGRGARLGHARIARLGGQP